nr:MAG TPA: hypothetical protein [Caudoviricetes sp.]
MSKERKHFLPKQFSLNDLNILDCVALIVYHSLKEKGRTFGKKS